MREARGLAVSIMSSFRDTLSTLSLEQALGRLRDQQMDRLLDGKPISDEALRQAERAIAVQLAEHFYGDATHQAMAIAPGDGQGGVLSSFAARSTVMADAAILLAHRMLCRVPVVGDPEGERS